MNALLYLLTVAVTLGLIVGVYALHKKCYALQYFFFARFPLLMAAVVALLPVVANWFAPTMLKNAFELNRPGAFVVGLIGAYCVFSILYNFMLIWHSTPFRAGLVWDREHQEKVRSGRARPEDPPKALLDRRCDLATVAILAPSWLVVALNAEGGAAAGAVWFGAGAALAFGLRYGLAACLNRVNWELSPRTLERGIRRWLYEETPKGVKGFLQSPFNGYRVRELRNLEVEERDPKTGETRTRLDLRMWFRYLALHFRAFAFFGSWMLIVLLGYLAKPTYPWVADTVPALAYLLILLTAVTWMLGFLSFTFDTSRLPILTVIVVFLFTLNLFVESGYTYRLLERAEGAEPASIIEALDAHAAGREAGDPPLALVAASGGGITASLWTTTVLDGLAEASAAAGVDFHGQVASVSGVSGGAVGTIHYINAFGEDGSPPSRMKQVVEASATSSLSAAVWGMAYPDFLRQFTGAWLLGSYDRAQAQEERWDRLLSGETGELVTIGDWMASVADGRRPVPILNATMEESGERLLITPVTLPYGPERGRHNLIELLPRSDIRASTAARLSATFPYVTPQARPEGADRLGARGYHAADGGFYDNSGIVSLLDVMDLWLSEREEKDLRVALIEIRAGTDAEGTAEAKPDRRSALKGLIGPLSTMFSVRTSSQIARNRFEIDLFAQAWADAVELEHFSFELSGDAPLSWHLSQRDIAFIRSHWPSGAAPGVEADVGKAAKEADERERVRSRNKAELERFIAFMTGPAGEAK